MPSLIYSFDTSALIDGLERYYPQKNFPALWQKIDLLINQGRLLISEEVWQEACRTASATQTWCNDPSASRDRSIVKTDAGIISIVGQIMNDYPQWSNPGARNGADPFVIAVAEVTDGMVITGEKKGGPSKPKIPYVSDQRSVKNGGFVDVIITENWTF